MRLNRFIAHHTKYSRREADGLIKEGVVTINKDMTNDTHLALQVRATDKICIKGRLIVPKKNYTVIIYHKPKGELVTRKDDKGRKTIFDSLPRQFIAYRPIGRLDFSSEGLLLLTDSPRIADQLMHSSLERIYNIKIRGSITEAMITAMQEGILIDSSIGGHRQSPIQSMDISPFSFFKVIKNQSNYSKIKVGITEGKNRELRRFFAHFKREVLDLKRVQFGSFMLSSLPVGKYRYLTKSEYSHLREIIKK